MRRKNLRFLLLSGLLAALLGCASAPPGPWRDAAPDASARLWPEPGAGLREGLSDIRMNGFYRLLEQKRPVGRPGYEPPKGWPCKDCQRGK